MARLRLGPDAGMGPGGIAKANSLAIIRRIKYVMNPQALRSISKAKQWFCCRQWDGTAYYNAFVRRHDGTHWATVNGNPDIIQLDTEDLGSVGAGFSSSPMAADMDIAIDDSGNAAAVWTQDDGFYVNMWASQFDGVDLEHGQETGKRPSGRCHAESAPSLSAAEDAPDDSSYVLVAVGNEDDRYSVLDRAVNHE